MTPPSSLVITAPAGRPRLRDEARELWRYRHLVRTLVERDLRSRYKNSVIGIGWTMINPLIQVLVLTVTIKYILNAGPENLSAYILCAQIPWTFFQTSVLDSSTSVLVKLGLLKKVYFPREIPLIATVCQNFSQFLISLGVFVLYRWVLTPLIFGWPGPPTRELLWLPVITAMLFLLTLGVAFIVATANVFYEDVKFIITIVMGFLSFLLPIIYFAENIYYSKHGSPRMRSWIYHLYLANPLAWIVNAFKQMFFGRAVISNPGAPLLYSAPFDWRYLLICGALSVAVFLYGYSFFNAHKWKFTERP